MVQRDAQPRTETGEDREAETAPSFLIGIEFEAMGRVLDWVSEWLEVTTIDSVVLIYYAAGLPGHAMQLTSSPSR